MSIDEVDYYERRAEEHIEAAQQSEHADVVKAHYELASHYLDRIHGDEPRSEPNFLTL